MDPSVSLEPFEASVFSADPPAIVIVSTTSETLAEVAVAYIRSTGSPLGIRSILQSEMCDSGYQGNVSDGSSLEELVLAERFKTD